MIRLFVLYHDNESKKKAEEFTKSREEWALPVLLTPPTFLLEYYFFTNKMVYEEVKDFKWVGTVSYKVVTKLGMDKIRRMKKLMKDTIDNTATHVLAFYGNTEFEKMGSRDDICHPGLTTLMKKVLELAGEEPHHIASIYSPSMKQFYSAYFVARPVWMFKFIEWFRKIIILLCVNIECHQLCLQNSTYSPSSSYNEIAHRIYNLPYIPMYPFFCERMIPYFFHTREANIIVLPD